MATLTICEQCGHKPVSTAVYNCPKCGRYPYRLMCKICLEPDKLSNLCELRKCEYHRFDVHSDRISYFDYGHYIHASCRPPAVSAWNCIACGAKHLMPEKSYTATPCSNCGHPSDIISCSACLQPLQRSQGKQLFVYGKGDEWRHAHCLEQAVASRRESGKVCIRCGRAYEKGFWGRILGKELCHLCSRYG